MFTLADLKTWARNVGSVTPSPREDSLEAFGSEKPSGAIQHWTASSPRTRAIAGSVASLLIVAIAGGAYLIRTSWPLSWPFRGQVAEATLTIESEPPGAEVLEAGVYKGTTPLALSVAPGDYAFEVVQ